jgi:serine protease Do
MTRRCTTVFPRWILLCLTFVLWSGGVGRGLAAGAKTPLNEITITSAIYGLVVHTADVTARVRELIQPGAPAFVVNYASLRPNPNPAPGTKKHLVINYTYRGVAATITVQEDQGVSYEMLVKNAEQTAATAAPAAAEPALTKDQMAGVVLVEGNKGVGTGFLAKVRGKLCVVTNLHVLGDNDKVTVKDMEGKEVAFKDISAAVGADIALLQVVKPELEPSPLELADNVLKSINIGDKVIVVGNRLGGGVATQTSGQIKGIGPDRIELDAEFQHGNSGSPIFEVATKQVIGVATYTQTNNAETVLITKGKKKPATQEELRWFGFRLDTVKNWQDVNWTRWHDQSERIDAFRDASLALLHVVEGQLDEAKNASPRLKAIIAPCDAALARVKKAHAEVEPPAQADLDQINEMFHEVNALAAAGAKEFANADYYDFFSQSWYFDTSVPIQASFREELIKALKAMEDEFAAKVAAK